MIQLTLVTGAGRVSVSRRLLLLLSPLVREAVSRMVELVLTGRTRGQLTRTGGQAH